VAQAAGNALAVILSEAKNLSWFFLEVNRREILRCAQNDIEFLISSSLFSLSRYQAVRYL